MTKQEGMTKLEILGSAGCQPAVAGSLPATLWAATAFSKETLRKFSAGCRKRQAGSLRCPEIVTFPSFISSAEKENAR
jgi:hypothetical protein